MHDIIRSENTFLKDYGWHTGRFYFPFGDYVDPQNKGFGVLSALNDFCVKPGMGFTTHGHAEIEIITLVLEGTLIHQDNLGFEVILERGDCQYTCTGSGILHSEMNGSREKDLRFLQIWIEPREKNLPPFYCQIKSNEQCESACKRHIASGSELESVQQIMQDANIYTLNIRRNHRIEYLNGKNRQSLVVCLEGKVNNGEATLQQFDAEKVLKEENLFLMAREDSRLLVVEMAKV